MSVLFYWSPRNILCAMMLM